jgi:hypothetical protein
MATIHWMTAATTAIWLAIDLSVAAAQAVQLPTFESHSSGGTVLVPDRGGISLPKVGRRGVQAPSARPGLGRGRAQGTVAGGSSVSADVQDLAEMDRQALKEARDRRAARDAGETQAMRDADARAEARHQRRPALYGVPAPAADDEQAEPDRSTAATPIASIAEIRRERAAIAAVKQRHAEESYQLGERALADGQKAVAISFFRLAIHYGDAALMNKASARLANVEQAARDEAAARRARP